MNTRFEYYKREYLFQLERRNEFQGRFTLPFTIVVALIGGASYLLRHAANVPVAHFVFGVSVIVYLVALLLAITHLVRAYHGHQYAYVPTPKQLEEYRSKLEDYYSGYGVKGQPDFTFNKALLEHYLEATEHNTKVNDLRSGYLHKATNCLIIASIAGAIAMFPLHFESVQNIWQMAYGPVKEVFASVKRGQAEESLPTTFSSSTSAPASPVEICKGGR